MYPPTDRFQHHSITAHPDIRLPQLQTAVTWWSAQTTRLKMAVAALPIVLLSLLLGSLIGAHHASYAKVTVANQEVSADVSPAFLSQKISEASGTYKLPFHMADGSTQAFAPAEMGITIDANKSAQQALSAKHDGSWLAHAAWWRQRHVPLSLSVNQNQLQQFSQTHFSKQLTPARDAKVVINNGQAKVVAEADGKAVALPHATTAITQQAAYLSRQPLQQQTIITKPNLTTINMAAAAQKVNDMLQTRYTISIADKKIMPSRQDIATWITVTPNEAAQRGDVAVNNDALTEYIDKVSEPYIATARPAVYDNQSGTTTTILAGQDGSEVTNKASAVAALAKSLQQHQPATVELHVAKTSHETIAAGQGDRRLLVDLTQKRMYAVEGENVVRTFLISAGAPDTPTITGTYNIYSKLPSQDMSGPNADGSSYSQPNVQWIEYFYKDFAVHGNYWRPTSYFGNINSSHGCVGVVNDDAQWIYNWTQIGTPVTVYN